MSELLNLTNEPPAIRRVGGGELAVGSAAWLGVGLGSGVGLGFRLGLGLGLGRARGEIGCLPRRDGCVTYGYPNPNPVIGCTSCSSSSSARALLRTTAMGARPLHTRPPHGDRIGEGALRRARDANLQTLGSNAAIFHQRPERAIFHGARSFSGRPARWGWAHGRWGQ